MEPLAILYADPLDILFENRNKSYGAYPLRKFYTRRLLSSLGILFLLVAVASLLYLGIQKPRLSVFEPEIVDVNIIQIDPTVAKPIVRPLKPSAPRPAAVVRYVTPVIVADTKIAERMSTAEEIKTSSIGELIADGDGPSEETGQRGNGVSGVVAGDSGTPDAEPDVYGVSEIMPEFPGGPEALKRYLTRNLRMPENKLEAGQQVRVMARFIVGADGKVRDIEISGPADAAFYTEVRRVMLKMPDWKPGLQHNRAVAVYYTLPVNFVNAE